jgi:predicted RNase H-like HicB family nuclease
MSTNASPGSVIAEYAAVIKQDASWWIGWIEEVPGVNCQERSREKLLGSLKIALREALQMNRDDARSAAGADFLEVKIAVGDRATSIDILM